MTDDTFKLFLPILIVAGLISSCVPDAPVDLLVEDQCLRAELFQICLSKLPTGPTHTVASNDWDEVVDACEHAAAAESIRLTSTVKPMCRGYNQQ